MSAAFMEQLIPLLLTITPLMLSRTRKHWKEEVKSFYAELDRTCSFFTTNKQKGKKKEIISCISSHEHTHNKLQHRDDARLLVSLEHIQYNQFGILEKKRAAQIESMCSVLRHSLKMSIPTLPCPRMPMETGIRDV